MTNRDKINQMTNAELAKIIVGKINICEYCIYSNSIGCFKFSCSDGLEKWLDQEVEK